MIIVSGASRGLGRAIAERLHARGEPVLGLARQAAEAPFPMLACDVSDADAVKAAARHVKGLRQPVRALVNAAGIASMNLALTTPAATAARIVTTNLLGTIYCCQQFTPLMVRNKAGVVLNFSTIAVALGLKGESIYAASKAGVEGFSRAFAREMADFGIRVNCIAPGPIATDLIQGVPDAAIERIVSQQIIPRQHQAGDVCDLVELLLDARGASLSGQVLHVGGA